MLNHLSMAYLLSYICTENYLNRTTIVEIIVGDWIVSFLRHSVVYWMIRIVRIRWNFISRPSCRKICNGCVCECRNRTCCYMLWNQVRDECWRRAAGCPAVLAKSLGCTYWSAGVLSRSCPSVPYQYVLHSVCISQLATELTGLNWSIKNFWIAFPSLQKKRDFMAAMPVLLDNYGSGNVSVCLKKPRQIWLFTTSTQINRFWKFLIDDVQILRYRSGVPLPT